MTAPSSGEQAPRLGRRLRSAGHRWRHSLRHSIKGRLVALFVLLALATTAVFLFGMQRAVQGGWLAYARPLAADYLDRLAAELGTPPSAERAAALVARLPITLSIEGPVLHYESHPQAEHRSRWRTQGDDPAHGFDAAAWGLTRTTADGHRITFGLVEPGNAWRARSVGWATLLALLALTAIAYAAVSRLLRPLREITRGVEAFGRGDFATPIPLRRRDELGDLTTRINAMAASLHGRLEAKRLLLLAISHELRSPLTRARLHTELLPESSERAALLHDLAEMRDLVSDLLESERLAEGHAALQLERLALGAWVRQFMAERFAAPLQAGQIRLDVDDSIGVRAVDALRLGLALRNLVENALRHGSASAAPGGGGGLTSGGGTGVTAEGASGRTTAATPAPIVVFLRREQAGALPAQLALGVRDHGPGIAPEHLAHLGEAFYRPDPARSRASGGVGLGLHLCRLVAEAHGGRLRLTPAQPGLEAALVWPEVTGNPAAPAAPPHWDPGH